MKVLDGQLMETKFCWPSGSPTDEATSTTEGAPEGEPMEMLGIQTYEKDMVAYINDSIGLHRVENTSHTDKAVSLHLYSPPFNECHTFDDRTGQQRVAKITFWSKYGERCPIESGTNECSAVKSV
jgi:cysteine dioxygenase